ncbi:MAG: hypothetical protein Fur0025_00970 [Oscillatoriaceae cyanobacterium]
MWQKLTKQIRQLPGVLVIAPSVAGLAIAGSIAGIFQLLEWATLDRFFSLRPTEPVDERIVIVTVGESDITRLGQWPMSDGAMAQILQNIQAQQPLGVGIDIYRDLPVAPGHDELVALFKSTPNIIGIEKVGGKKIAPSPTLKQLGQVGASDLVMDADGKVRRGLILIGTEEGEYREGLAVKLALLYLKNQGITLEEINGAKQIYGLGKAKFVPLTKEHEGGGYVGTDTAGYQILMNYRGGLERFHHISLTDVLENRIPAGLFRDRIVYIGATAPSLNDLFQTPLNIYFNPLDTNRKTQKFTTELTPGVVIHANLTSQILRAAIEGRPMLQAWSKKLNWAWIVAWSFIGAGLCWQLLETKYFKNNTFYKGTATSIIISGSTIFSISYFAFAQGWVIPVFSPILAMTASAVLITNYHNQWQLKRTNDALEKANETLEEYARKLELKVEERTREIKSALENLKSTQAQLIHAEKMSSLGQMVAGVAHEINNPISFIYGNLTPAADYIHDLLNLITLYREHYPEPVPEIKDEIESIDLEFLIEDLQKLLESMKGGATRIRNIVLSLRNFSRLDESDMKEVNIHEGIESTLVILHPRLEEKGIKLLQEYGKIPLVSCYASQINQVFMNILNNAVSALSEQIKPAEIGNGNGKYNGCTKQDLTITIRTAVTEDNFVKISIADNGPGISETVLPKTFDPFFTTKPVGAGTGLGLSTSYFIVVDRHGGKLRCVSEPGKGAEFIVEIPIYQGTEKLKPAPPVSHRNDIGG